MPTPEVQLDLFVTNTPDIARVVSVHSILPQQTPWLPMLVEHNSVAAASFRVLRYRLRKQGDPKIVAVTSPKANEGKTSTAINLAMALAEDGKARVLLMEANFHRPKIAESLGFTPQSCFVQQLDRSLNGRSDNWEVVSAFSENLHVLAATPSLTKPVQTYVSTLNAAIRQLASQTYAYIVVDCPPVLGSAEVNMLADTVDALLFTAICGRSRARDLRRAQEHLDPANIIGTVLLGAK